MAGVGSGTPVVRVFVIGLDRITRPGRYDDGAVNCLAKPVQMRSPRTFPSRFFDRLAEHYESHAALQTEVAERLLSRLDGLRFEPSRIVDIGCADGRQCQALHQRFPKARVIGIDLSTGMLSQAKARRRWWRRNFELLRADGSRLPLAEDSVDLVYANLSLGWLDDIEAALRSWRRVLRPGGLALLSTYGPDTLRPQRARLTPPPAAFSLLPDVQRLGTLLVRAGFAEPVLDTDWITTVFPHSAARLAELRGCGLLPAAHTGLGKQRGQRLAAASAETAGEPCRAVWEVVSASVWAPEAGQPIRDAAGEEVSVPVTAIGVRRRD